MICDEVFSKELAKAFNLMDIRCALIFHEREQKSLDNPYIQSLQEINSNNLFLSLNPLPYQDIHKVFMSTDIGLACYRDVDENFSEISKASGKLSFYLKHGKPTIVNNIPSLRRLNDRYKFGILIEDISNYLEIEAAIAEIMNNYQYFSDNALYCFKQEFDFQLITEPLLDFLDFQTKANLVPDVS
jgi:glycosyltransferase involved in cell wall biosynthesis